MAEHTAPGVYVNIIDNSAVSSTSSLFKLGLVGPATKGPLNTPTSVGSVRKLKSVFGGQIDGDYTMTTAAAVAQHSDGVYMSRIAAEYTKIGSTTNLLHGPYSWSREGDYLYIDDVVHSIPIAESGKVWIRVFNSNVAQVDLPVLVTADSFSLHVPVAQTGGTSGSGLTFYYLYEITDTELAPQIKSGMYIKIYQPGLDTTSDVYVTSVDYSTGRIKFVRAPGYSSPTTLNVFESETAGVVEAGATPIAAPYTDAFVYAADTEGAANEAEAFLTAPTWGTEIATFTVSGKLNSYSLQANVVESSGATDIYTAFSGANINPGSTLIRITEAGKRTTYEALVKSVDHAGKIVLQPSIRGDIGYQPVALADTYVSARVSVCTGQTRSVHLVAASAGTWANTGENSGLSTVVSPGSRAGTKRLKVYENGMLVDDLDSLSIDPNSERYWTTYVNANATAVKVVNEPTEHPSNTMNPWLSTKDTINSPEFSGGANGSNVSTDDYIGVDDGNGNVTGWKAYSYTNTLPDMKVLACPGNTDLLVAKEMARIAGILNCQCFVDTPDGYNLIDAVAWHNSAIDDGTSAYTKLDTWKASFFWNWSTIDDPLSGRSIWVPPSVVTLERVAKNFDQYKPWNAHAGLTRGVLTDVSDLRYPKVSQDMLDAAYGDGNCINPIIIQNGSYVIWGNRTTQRAETKLSALNNAFLINEIVQRFSKVCRAYTFEPLDATLYDDLRQDLGNILDGIKNERGIEEYTLTIDSSNNDAETRNQRRANVSFSVVPTDAAERFYITGYVNSSSMTVTSVS